MTAMPVTSITPQPVSTIETITPAIAAQFLTHNSSNRNLRAKRVARYAKDMQAGAWHIGNDAITFAADGTLLNGQHRLHAVVDSGCTVDMMVLRNAKKESMVSMDTGASRTSADYFGKAGLNEANPTLLTATIKQLILLETGNITRDRSGQEVTNFAMEEWLEDHPEVRESVATGQKYSSGSRQIETTARVLAIVHYLISQKNSTEIADYFFKQVSTRVGEPEGSPVHAIDSRLRSLRRERAHEDVNVMVAFLIRGWNAYADGRRVAQMPLRAKQDGPVRVPEVSRWTRSNPVTF